MSVDKTTMTALIGQLDEIEDLGRRMETQYGRAWEQIHPSFYESLQNLLHYLALRHHDIRDLQNQLGMLGVSRLGRAESHVLASVRAIRDHLARHCGVETAAAEAECMSFAAGQRLLRRHAEQLLGPPSHGRGVRIMVTLPTEAADAYDLVRGLVRAGADAVRINCAHDEPDVWRRMIANVRRAARELRQPCTVCMDLAGPKLRVGAMQEGPRVVRVRPERDPLGRVVAPGRAWLAPADVPPPEDAAHLFVSAAHLQQMQPGDVLCFRDARGKKRAFSVVAKTPDGCWTETSSTAYVLADMLLEVERGGAQVGALPVGALPPREEAVLLRTGDTLLLHLDDRPGEPARYDAHGVLLAPAHVSCLLPNVYSGVRPGEPILFDDGRVEGIVRAVEEGQIEVEVTYAGVAGTRLRGYKGINLPESALRLHGLSEKDREDLAFVVRHADVVNVSFVNDVEDVAGLHAELERLGAPEGFGVILKIETKRGYYNLPSILMTAMRRAPLGVMIARGDLAVECGWDVLAEVQEEILRLCEAAHVPIVWATQVLENLAKKGRPSRAEITDAAMSQRAECVMLNKGPYIVEAIQMLDEILRRMQDFQQKKAPMLPSLATAEPFSV